MPNPQYRIGRQREIDVIDWYTQRGWLAVRMGGSLGAADVIALKAGEQAQFVQVKADHQGLYCGFGPDARRRLLRDARRAGAVPLLCKWPHGSAESPRFVGADEWPKDLKRSEPEYVVDEETGCWIWARATTSDGYGQVTRRIAMGQVHHLAHRYYYATHKGAIPEGLEVDHVCRVRACVNPEHLEAVTKTQNIRRTAITKLTAEQVRQIRESKESNKKLALIYDVDRTWIWSLKRGARWEDVQVDADSKAA